MRNVVVLCLDTVRKDYFDEFAPRLKERSDIDVEQARAASGWSLPSHASMLSGTLPHEHGVHTHARDFGQLPRSETFLDRLPNHQAVGVSTNAFASESFGFDRYFDTFHFVSRRRIRCTEGLHPTTFEGTHTGISKNVEYFTAALRDSHPFRSVANGFLSQFNLLRLYKPLFRERPWPEIKDNGTKQALTVARDAMTEAEETGEAFVGFLNLMEAHPPMYHHRDYDESLHDAPTDWNSKDRRPGPYEINHNVEEHTEFLEYWRGLYGASIDYLDRHVSAWIDTLLDATTRPTSVILTADHGHNLGTSTDENLFGHQTSLGEGILHVPLTVVNAPEDFEISRSGYVSHLDLGDLIVALAQEGPAEITRKRVPAEVIGHTASAPETDPTYWDRQIRCVYTVDGKTVWDSLGTVKTVEVDPDRPCWQRVSEGDGGPPAVDTELFETDIRTSKRQAVLEAIEADIEEVDQSTKTGRV